MFFSLRRHLCCKWLYHYRSYNGPCAVLGQDRLWWIFLLSSIVTPFILAFLVLTVRLLIWIEYYRKQTNKSASRISFLRWFSQFQNEIQIPSLTAIRDAADTIVSVRYKAGRILVSVGRFFVQSHITVSLCPGSNIIDGSVLSYCEYFFSLFRWMD